MDDVWSILIAQANDRAPCCSDEALCHVRVAVGPLHAIIVHSTPGVAPHACAFCPPGDPRHLVSIDSLQTVKRDALVARIARFFNHAHAETTQGAELRAA